MSDALTLRERLLRDFGVDLPIHGGTGRRDAPIVVSTADLQSAVDVQMTAIGCFEIVDAGLRTVRVGIETIEIGERDVTTQQEACYFALDAMPTNGTVMSLPAPSGFVDPRSGLRLPYQLGWLQFDGSTDNEPAHPGLGWSAAYGGLGIRATVYAYDQGKAIEPDDLPKEAEIHRMAQETIGALIDAVHGSSRAVS